MAERREREFPARLENRLPSPERSRWNAQRRLKHLPRTLSNLSTTVSQTSKSLLVRRTDYVDHLLYYCWKDWWDQKTAFILTGTTPKNTHFDPNQQGRDFKKKVAVVLVTLTVHLSLFITIYVVPQKLPKGQKPSCGPGGRSMSYLAGKSER